MLLFGALARNMASMTSHTQAYAFLTEPALLCSLLFGISIVSAKMSDKPACEKLLIPHLCTCSVVEFDRSGIVFDRLLVELNGHHGRPNLERYFESC